MGREARPHAGLREGSVLMQGCRELSSGLGFPSRLNDLFEGYEGTVHRCCRSGGDGDEQSKTVYRV